VSAGRRKSYAYQRVLYGLTKDLDTLPWRFC